MDRTERPTRVASGAAAALVAFAVLGLASRPTLGADNFMAYTPLTPVTITCPDPEEETFWCAESEHTVERAPSSDTDMNTCTAEPASDSVSHWWTHDEGGGSFPYGNIGVEDVTYKCPAVGQAVKITVHANDDYAPDNNDYLQLDGDDVEVTAVSAEIKSVLFTSDHGVLRDNNTDWTDTGTVYDPRGWRKSPAANNPISHTQGEYITADVVICVEPSGVEFSLEGDGPIDALDFVADAETSTGADQTIYVSSTSALPGAVDTLDHSIDWTALAGSSASADCYAGASGSHKIYVTHGTPPIWKILDSSHSGGSCIAHSNLLMHIVNLLGVPGGTLAKVYSSTDLNFDSQESHTINGHACTVVVVVPRGTGYEYNYYEACLHIEGRYYPGAFGNDSFASKEAVHDSYAAWGNRLVYKRTDAAVYYDRHHTAYPNPLTITEANCIPLP